METTLSPSMHHFFLQPFLNNMLYNDGIPFANYMLQNLKVIHLLTKVISLLNSFLQFAYILT